MKRSALMSEADLQQHVVKLLEAYARQEVCYWHSANGEARHVTIGRKLKRMGVKKGVADLVLIVSGRAIALELKTEIGTQSKEQAEWQEQFERAGGAYYMARGMDEALATLITLGVFRDGMRFTNTFPSPSAGREARRGNGSENKGPFPQHPQSNQ